jgi:hypothetical protein
MAISPVREIGLHCAVGLTRTRIHQKTYAQPWGIAIKLKATFTQQRTTRLALDVDVSLIVRPSE